MKFPKFSANFDFWLIAIPILLAVASVSTLFSITSVTGKTNLAIDQIINFAIGFVIYFAAAAFNYRQHKTYSFYMYLFGIAGLIAVVFLGQTVFGSTRWINLGFTQYQPSELMKFFALIFFAAFLAEKKMSVKSIILYLIMSVIPIYLVFDQPDLGTALTLIIIAITVFLTAKPPKKVVAIALVISCIAAPIGWFGLKPYQKERLTTFMNPSSDPLGSGYNVNQSKIAVGSGGLTGKGFGNATQSQLQFIPVAHVDFIFSGWAEATGFVGSSAMIAAYVLLLWRILVTASRSQDKFGGLFCFGVAGMITFQTFVNIAMNIGLAPVTGIPLPLVSYGGTSVLTTMLILGTVQSIYLRQRSLKFD